jgi:DHA2 family multidrug resistance protein-like MFS transporter
MRTRDGRRGAAGSLEATGYELGTGLGITLFGVFLSSAFSLAIELSSSLSRDLAEQASRMIGDASIVASALPQGAALIEAGKAAFTETHAVLLTTASAVIAALAVVVYFTLAGYRSLSRAHPRPPLEESRTCRSLKPSA